MKLTGRWFPQIVQWESISNIYITKIVVLVSEPVRGRSRATELPCFQYFMFYSRFLLFPTFNKNIGVQKNSGEGFFFFLEKHFFIISFSHFMLFSTLTKN